MDEEAEQGAPEGADQQPSASEGRYPPVRRVSERNAHLSVIEDLKAPSRNGAPRGWWLWVRVVLGVWWLRAGAGSGIRPPRERAAPRRAGRTRRWRRGPLGQRRPRRRRPPLPGSWRRLPGESRLWAARSGRPHRARSWAPGSAAPSASADSDPPVPDKARWRPCPATPVPCAAPYPAAPCGILVSSGRGAAW